MTLKGGGHGGKTFAVDVSEGPRMGFLKLLKCLEYKAFRKTGVPYGTRTRVIGVRGWVEGPVFWDDKTPRQSVSFRRGV